MIREEECECLKTFGPGLLCGRPSCVEVQKAQRSLADIVRGIVKDMERGPPSTDTFKIPDWRDRS